MTWIKICGTTSFEDATTAIDAGANALGFVFYEGSPRNVSAEAAQKIVSKLPADAETVGVFVEGNGSPHEWFDLAEFVGLSALQIHTGFLVEHRAQFIEQLAAANSKRRKTLYLIFPATVLLNRNRDERPDASSHPNYWKMLGDGEDRQTLFDAIFVDSGTSGQPGGTGRLFDWQASAPTIAELSERARVVVSGGLNPDNVAEAIRILKPWGVDVVSGVETAHGKKDPDKVRAFVRAVRNAEQSIPARK